MTITNAGEIATAGPTIHWAIESGAQMPPFAPADQPFFLANEELSHYRSLSVPKRREEWLLGRWTAKRLIQRVISHDSNVSVRPQDIQIHNRSDGSPVVELAGLASLTLTISHSHGHAFCAVVAGSNQLIGADLEHIEPRSKLFAEDYFTTPENDVLDRAKSEAQRSLLTTAIWSGKEASLKAVRAGLTVDTRSVTCLFDLDGLDAAATWSPFQISWTPESGLPSLTGLWRQIDPFVLTLALGRNLMPRTH